MVFNPSLLHAEVQDFIRNYSDEITSLAFRGSPFPEIPVQELMQQIDSRNRIKKKLPTWFTTEGIIYPPKLNLEQTSSEITAIYKASLISGKTLADITGGFGVDAFFFSEKFEKVFHFEWNKELSEIAEHNFKVFGKTTIACNVSDGIKAIQGKQFDVIFADPSRRDSVKGKVYYLRDCFPNIPEELPKLFESAPEILIKTSPMLDLNVGIEELRFVQAIHIVSVRNEVKELLWLLKKEVDSDIEITTINFEKETQQRFDFLWNQEATPTFSEPKNYLYEPNVAILKSGAFDLVSEEFKLDKLHRHTHLYTHEKLVDFPGRRFKIIKRIPYQKSEMRKLKISKANVSVRNFPESVAQIRKKWKIGNGGEIYLFFITTGKDNKDKKEVLICEKA